MALKLPKAWATWRSIPPKDPKRLLKLIEAGIKLRNERKELEAQGNAILEEEKALTDFLIKTFEKADLKEVKTPLGTARLVYKDIPVMDPDTGGWDAIYAYIVKNKAWELLQKRLGERACQERWEAKQTIPGVKQFTKVTVKLGDAE